MDADVDASRVIDDPRVAAAEVVGPAAGFHRGLAALLAPVSVALAVWGVLVAHNARATGTLPLQAAIVTAWAIAGTAAAFRRPREGLSDLVLRGCLVGALAVLTGAALRAGTHGHPLGSGTGDAARLVLPLAIGLLPAAALNVVIGLPDGRCRVSRAVVIGGYAVGLAVGILLWAQRPSVPLWPVLAEGAIAAAVGIGVMNRRYVRSRGAERQRWQWFGWAVAVGLEVTLVAIAARLLTGWPHEGAAIAAAATLPLPVALALGSFPKVMGRVDALLAHTVSVAGLTGVVIAVYLVIVIGLGHVPTAGERPLLGLSMLAAGVAALLYVPARERLSRFPTAWSTARRSRPTPHSRRSARA
ncbi:MAG: hypothetical protein ACRDJU_15350 [Actinomycetota bacterium]